MLQGYQRKKRALLKLHVDRSKTGLSEHFACLLTSYFIHLVKTIISFHELMAHILGPVFIWNFHETNSYNWPFLLKTDRTGYSVPTTEEL